VWPYPRSRSWKFKRHWLGMRQQLMNFTVRSPNAIVTFATLDVKLDSQQTMANHVAALSRSCFFCMRQHRSIKQALVPDATRTLLLAVGWTTVTAYLLASGINCFRSYKLFRTLPLIRKCKRITPVLHDLHWLSIRQQIMFRTAVLAFMCQHGVALQYLHS